MVALTTVRDEGHLGEERGNQMGVVKKELQRIARDLPDDATWADVMEAVYLQHVIDEGLQASAEGRTRSVDEVRRSHGLPARP